MRGSPSGAGPVRESFPQGWEVMMMLGLTLHGWAVSWVRVQPLAPSLPQAPRVEPPKPRSKPVPYTHPNLPRNREVLIHAAPGSIQKKTEDTEA